MVSVAEGVSDAFKAEGGKQVGDDDTSGPVTWSGRLIPTTSPRAKGPGTDPGHFTNRLGRFIRNHSIHRELVLMRCPKGS